MEARLQLLTDSEVSLQHRLEAAQSVLIMLQNEELGYNSVRVPRACAHCILHLSSRGNKIPTGKALQIIKLCMDIITICEQNMHAFQHLDSFSSILSKKNLHLFLPVVRPWVECETCIPFIGQDTLLGLIFIVYKFLNCCRDFSYLVRYMFPTLFFRCRKKC
jgi:hypothetical protein